MFLATAFIFTKDPQTDEQLAEIMKTQPWTEQGRAHGCWHDQTGSYEEPRPWERYSTAPDSMYLDAGWQRGYGLHASMWLDDEMDLPAPNLMGRRAIGEPWWERNIRDGQELWKLTVKYVLAWLPDGYHFYCVNYGMIEDEDPDQIADRWRDLIVTDIVNYDPQVIAKLGWKPRSEREVA
jgi:hypothetical protein